MTIRNGSNRKLIQILKAAKPLLLSHHPFCSKFENHTIKIKNRRICLGCLVLYPTFVITLSFFILFWDQLSHLPNFLFLFSALFISLKFIKIEQKSIKITINLLFGFGVASTIFFIFSLPYTYWLKIILLLVFITLTGLVAGYKFEEKIKVCDLECEYKRNWVNCPGLKNVYYSIYTAQK